MITLTVGAGAAPEGAAGAAGADARAGAPVRGVVVRRLRAGAAGVAGVAGAAGVPAVASVDGFAGDVRLRAGVAGTVFAAGAGCVAEAAVLGRVRRRVVGVVVAPLGEAVFGVLPFAMPIPSCWSRFCTLLPS